jgi:inner membrane protein
MMTVTHLLIGSLATGLFLQTPQPELLLVSAIASLLPDIDISTSPIGRILFPISQFLEKRFAHRSATHSIVASALLGIISYGAAIAFKVDLSFIHALNIGYFAGWFADCFTKSGVQMFYPLPQRCVCPGNRELRLSTGSTQEYFLVGILIIIAFWTFQINSDGGVMTAFNKVIAAPSGVTELYNKEGGNHAIYANIEGVYASDRTPVKDKFLIVGASGNDFIVEKDGQLFKAGNDPDSTIITKRIIGEVGAISITQTEAIAFNEDDINPLVKFSGKQAYVTGTLEVDDPESIRVLPNLREYQSITINGSIVNLSFAPVDKVINLLSDQILIGNLSVKVINVQ